MNLFKGGMAVSLAWAVFGGLYLAGYIMNIIDLIKMDTIMNGEGAVRIIGIFVPVIGPVMGWFF